MNPLHPEARRDGATYMSTPEAALYLGLSRKSLEAWRLRGAGPAYIKLHGLRGAVRYARADLDRFMAQHRVGSEDAAQ